MEELNDIQTRIRAIQRDLEFVREIILMRMRGEDTTKRNDEARGYIKTIIGEIHLMGKEATEALVDELRRHQR